jgi:hypothetical protein
VCAWRPQHKGLVRVGTSLIDQFSLKEAAIIWLLLYELALTVCPHQLIYLNATGSLRCVTVAVGRKSGWQLPQAARLACSLLFTVCLRCSHQP